MPTSLQPRGLLVELARGAAYADAQLAGGAVPSSEICRNAVAGIQPWRRDMSPDEAGQFIAERIRVERADVAAIKSFAVSYVDTVLAENENDRAAGALLVQNLALAWLKH